MKKISLFCLLLASLLLATSCSPSANMTSSADRLVSSGTWSVSQFINNSVNETSNFNGYTFTFSSSGTISAMKNGVTQSGTWSFNSSESKFNIDLGPKNSGNFPLGELSDDWKIQSASEKVLSLHDDNAASNESLTFTKN